MEKQHNTYEVKGVLYKSRITDKTIRNATNKKQALNKAVYGLMVKVDGRKPYGGPLSGAIQNNLKRWEAGDLTITKIQPEKLKQPETPTQLKQSELPGFKQFFNKHNKQDKPYLSDGIGDGGYGSGI